ncbi:hypothetical protein AQUCO_01700072v1 [Aquilegia coerulea]|uniref:UPF3 domain-containing protein n=1 Tax=Aquilegia coerulea TaxID=218851 RepID=A0A2G5DL01_AQUCA|nr:hypothetical protein AQUCO_01700072v1 [Aquilegia coerulea]PIA44205.1 hypothetical protein AQUCO_01700072v1 [Aquilegia coerulea]
MKDPFDRTKVVLRHLPAALSQSALMEQIDGRFAGRYKWFSFRPGKYSQKHQKYARAYIDFRRPEDVVEFAEFFDGHVFVNEKGTQVKAIVEYSPSQRVPKSWCKKDGREGTIYKDPEYMEFLEFLAKPVENLPSAEIQLEKREAERAGAGKEPLIVTPLMDFVRQKRAAKSGTQRSSSNGKLSRRAIGASPGNSRPTSLKRGSEKRRSSTSMYVMRDSTKSASVKDKTYILVQRREDPSSDKPISANTESGAEIIADETGASGTVDFAKKKILLLKGKERDITHSYAGSSQQSATSVRNSTGSPASKHTQRREVGGKMIRSILSNKEARQSQASMAVQSEQQNQTMHVEKEKRPPRATNMRSILKDHLISNAACSSDSDVKRTGDVIGSDPHGPGSINEKQERSTKNRDRPDRNVWSHRGSAGSHGSDETLSVSESLEAMSIAHHSSAIGNKKLAEDLNDSNEKHHNYSSGHVDMRVDVPNSSRSREAKPSGNIRSGSSVENGSHRHVGRRGPAHGTKDVEGSLYLNEGKSSKRGEKQVWVQKSGSGS